MALAVGATSKGRTASASSIATTGVTTQAAGSTFLIGILFGAVTFTSLVDSKGNTYTQLGGLDLDPDGTGSHTRFYYCQNGVGGASHTATLTTNLSSNLEVLFVEITGAAAASFDLGNGNADTASPYTSPSISTTQAAEMLVALFFGNSGSNPATHAESTGFTIQAGAEETNGASFYTGCMATRIVASTSSYNASFTESGGTRGTAWILGLKEAAATASAAMQSFVHPGARPGRFQRFPEFRQGIATANLALAIDTAGSITVAGQSIAMSLGVALSTQGAISLQGQSVGLSLGIPVSAGLITLTGQSVTMSFNVAQGVAGSIIFAGQTVAMSLGAGVVIDTPGSLTLAGQSVTMTLGLALAPGAIALAGQSMTMKLDVALAAGLITLQGQSVSLTLNVALSAGSITFAGQTVALANGANLTLDIDTPGSIILSGQSVTLTGGTPIAGAGDSDFVVRRRRRS